MLQALWFYILTCICTTRLFSCFYMNIVWKKRRKKTLASSKTVHFFCEWLCSSFTWFIFLLLLFIGGNSVFSLYYLMMLLCIFHCQMYLSIHEPFV